MGWNDLIDVCNYDISDGTKQPDRSAYKGVGMDINIHEHYVDTTMMVEREEITNLFARYLGPEINSYMFDCMVEPKATYNIIERYYAGPQEITITDKDYRVDYNSNIERVDVCVRLSKILTWCALGYHPVVYKHDQIKLAYEGTRRVLETYKEDDFSLVKLELPEGVKRRLQDYVSYLEENFIDVIKPKVVEMDSPVSTFLDGKFNGLFGGNRVVAQMKTNNNDLIINNGFIMNEDDNSELFGEDSSLNRWQ